MFALGVVSAQVQPTPPVPPPDTPAESTGRTLPPPREVPSKINNGTGFSIQPLYWLTSGSTSLLPGKTNGNIDPGTLTYPTSARRVPGAQVSIPVSSSGVLRVSFFQAKNTDSTMATRKYNLYNITVTPGDGLPYNYKIQGFKVSYDYLTYFWQRGGQELRLKTLWEMQRIAVDNSLSDFTFDADGNLTQANDIIGSNSLTVPTLGMGLEHTLSPRFRWEGKASGWMLPHKAAVGDVEGSINFRVSHLELVLGGRSLYYKTSPKGVHYNSGRVSGPYIGIRYYFKKQ